MKIKQMVSNVIKTFTLFMADYPPKINNNELSY